MSRLIETGNVDIDAIKDQHPLAEVVGRHVVLKRRGHQAIVLVLLGLWWGQFVSARRPLERSTTLGLLALLGTLLLNGSYALQLQWRGESAVAAWQLSIAQALFTALLAPMICSLLVLFWRRHSLRHGR